MTEQYQSTFINDNPTAQSIALNAACAITAATGSITLLNSSAATKVITTTTSYAGQTIGIFHVANTGGDYTLAVTGGTLTFNAALEGATVMRNAANSAWVVVGLNGATVV